MSRFGAKTRFALRLVLATCVPLMVVEGVLQAGAWVAHATMNSREAGPEAGTNATVLCVGDSFTYGLGASDAAHAYPGALARKLGEAGSRRFNVVNGGWPGRDSWDVLRELPDQLDHHHPSIICVLVGLNDRWNHPSRHAISTGAAMEGNDRAVFHLRIVRLAKLVADAWKRGGRKREATRPAPARDDAAPFIGTWFDGAQMLRFDRGGRGFARGRECAWERTGSCLQLKLQDLPLMTVDWAIEGDRLSLSSKDGTFRVRCDRARPKGPRRDPDCEPPSPEFERGMKFLYAEDFTRSLEILKPLAARFPDSVCVHSGLAQVLGHLGRTVDAAPHIAWLETYYASHPTRSVAEMFCWALYSAVPGQPAFERLSRLAADHPDCVEVFRALAQRAHDVDDIPTTRNAIQHAIDLTPDDDIVMKGELIRRRSRLLKESDPDGALRDAITSYRIDGDREASLQMLRIFESVDGRARLRERVAALGLPGDDAARLNDLITDATRGDGALSGVIEFHLREMVALCRSRGVGVVILGYPAHNDIHEQAVARIGTATGVRVVTIASEFDRELTHRARAELFVTDGHCNDAGYEIVAEQVAGAVLELAQAR